MTETKAHPRLPGLVQWFTFESRTEVARTVKTLKDLHVTEIRVLFSWADWGREKGPEWFDYFVGELTSVPNVRLLPNLFYTPPSFARKDSDGNQKTSYPPEDLSSFARFVKEMIERYGEHFEWMELWNEANWKPYWDWDMDDDMSLFAEMTREAADVAHAMGKKVLLGGTTPIDHSWYARMNELGVLERSDAVAFHHSPSWESQRQHWMPLETEIAGFRALLAGLGHPHCEVWVEEIGFSTETNAEHDQAKLEKEQIDFFESILGLSAERLYWYCVLDQDTSTMTDYQLNTGDEPGPTAYHFGLITPDGREKPLYDHWRKRATS